ncbi:tRNA pseudouridine(38-40) synthase TruA [Campylobacter sp. 19-13652]|uniref:tRNA pseudouridine(38-40) synthase TruA n=1 Tax=Campylobacter sp. 19-13652 TaxID=2840180 RepID=UPI001C7980E2|nr:tRNA pseudouridine(38-40) synthase TruA [Campylobacter sp. 19-13652]BCX79438.1 tRNA pseudouridine synthase A [Campylobacter sp. 19-13652]
MKVALTFSYDGSRFLGSQSQPHGNSVEDALKSALACVGIFDAPIMSSRTDKGVHALRQCASVRVGEYWIGRTNVLLEQIQRHLPSSIRLSKIMVVDDGFHARYDATARTYRYIISHADKEPFSAQYYTYLPPFDVLRADRILSEFKGTKDFNAFMKVGSDTKSSIRTITLARCYKVGDKSVIVLRANGFLRSQVRLIVAAVLKALTLKNGADLQAIKDQLNGIKVLTRMPAPAQGLYLSRVHYF